MGCAGSTPKAPEDREYIGTGNYTTSATEEEPAYIDAGGGPLFKASRLYVPPALQSMEQGDGRRRPRVRGG